MPATVFARAVIAGGFGPLALPVWRFGLHVGQGVTE